MSKTAKKENDLVTIYKASQIIKVKARVLTYHIENGKIESTDGKIHKSVCNKILEQQSNYIGIRFFYLLHQFIMVVLLEFNCNFDCFFCFHFLCLQISYINR